MMNAAAPMIGGMIWPFVDAATSMAPALVAGRPVRIITGMVKVPVVTTLAIEEPEMAPVMPDARMAALAGPAAESSDHGEGEVEEILAGARLFEQGAEEDEQENEAHRDVDRDAEDGLAGQPVVADQARQRKAAVRDDVGHRLPKME